MARSELEMQIAERLGRIIKDEREAKGWTQLELSGRADVSASCMSLVENGGRIPLFHNFVKIAHALGWEKRTIAEIVGLAWKPLTDGRIGMRLELLPPDDENGATRTYLICLPDLRERVAA